MLCNFCEITSIKSHVLRYELEKELGYSQQYYKHRTAHLVEVQTDEGITGWGECYGPRNIWKKIGYGPHGPIFSGDGPFFCHTVHLGLTWTGRLILDWVTAPIWAI